MKITNLEQLIASILIIPISFVYISEIADKFMSISMKFISNSLKLSPTFAAVTLIAFANGAPDFLTAFNSLAAKNGLLIANCAILGAFLFSSCLGIAKISFMFP